MMKTTISAATLRALVLQGKTETQIAVALGATRDAVRKRLRDLGLKTERKNATATDLNALVQLWEAGLSIAEIARRLKCGDSTVDYHATKLGLSRRGRGRRRTDDVPVDSPTDAKPASQTAQTGLLGALLATQGKWAPLAAVAQRHGLTMTQAQQRYHRARAMG
jgi:DNA-binding CsgD family transcriptional regulator